MSVKSCCTCFLIIGLGLAAAVPISAQQYKAVPLKLPWDGYTTYGTVAQAMAWKTGQVVGWSHDSQYTAETDPLLWEDPHGYSNILPLGQGIIGGQVYAISDEGTVIGGEVYRSLSAHGQAVIWNADREMIVLHPQGYDKSIINCVSSAGGWQGGLVVRDIDAYYYLPHAALWNSSSTSFQDLHPLGYWRSSIRGISANALYLCGTGQIGDLEPNRALLWKRTGELIDLTPGGAVGAEATGITADGSIQTGNVWVSESSVHAGIWRGTAASFVDLTPDGATSAWLRGVSRDGSIQVGYIDAPDKRTGVWHGSKESYLDLTQFLPQGYVGGDAFAVDSEGNVVGSAGRYPYPVEGIYWRREIMRIKPEYLQVLLDDSKWRTLKRPNQARYFRFYPGCLPSASIASAWGGVGLPGQDTKITDATRVTWPGREPGTKPGQCVEFIWALANERARSLAREWEAIEPVMSGNKVRETLIAGDVIGTCSNGRYNNGHVAMFLRRISPTVIEVIDQNFWHDQIVGRHTMSASSLENYFTLKRKD